MTTARRSAEHHAPTAGDSDHVSRAHPQASKLFERDHAYAARLVQLVTAIRSVVRSTVTKNVPDQVPLVIQDDDLIAAGVVRQPQPRESSP